MMGGEFNKLYNIHARTFKRKWQSLTKSKAIYPKK
jgi:hypothetical protein